MSIPFRALPLSRLTQAALLSLALAGAAQAQSLQEIYDMAKGYDAAYQAAVAELKSSTLDAEQRFETLVLPDIRRACDLFLPLQPGTDVRMVSALVGFALFESAYYAEIIRAGIQSVPKGQLAAATALGLSRFQAMRLVVLPQALRNMVPLLLTQAIVLFQDTSLVYVSALADFFGAAYKVGDRDGRLVELLLFAGAVYFVLCFALSRLVQVLQKPRVQH